MVERHLCQMTPNTQARALSMHYSRLKIQTSNKMLRPCNMEHSQEVTTLAPNCKISTQWMPQHSSHLSCRDRRNSSWTSLEGMILASLWAPMVADPTPWQVLWIPRSSVTVAGRRHQATWMTSMIETWMPTSEYHQGRLLDLQLSTTFTTLIPGQSNLPSEDHPTLN